MKKEHIWVVLFVICWLFISKNMGTYMAERGSNIQKL